VGRVTTALVLAAALAAGTDAHAGERTYAVVVGNRVPPVSHDGLKTLRFADDDAIRWAELLRRLPGAT
jgi:hypothetical protein